MYWLHLINEINLFILIQSLQVYTILAENSILPVVHIKKNAVVVIAATRTCQKGEVSNRLPCCQCCWWLKPLTLKSKW